MWAQDIGEVVGEAAWWPESEKTHLMRGGARERRGGEWGRRARAGEREARGRGGALVMWKTCVRASGER